MTGPSSLPTSKDDFRELDPYYFEELVARIWNAYGHSTTITTGSKDKGIDIKAVSDGGNIIKLLQAKRYKRSNKIGSPEVRKYATLYQQEPAADEVIIITTSTFTSEAKELAEDLDVTLVDIDCLWHIYHTLVSHLDESNNVDRSVKNPEVDESEPSHGPILAMIEIETDLIPAYKMNLRRQLRGEAVELGQKYNWNDNLFKIVDMRPQNADRKGTIDQDTTIRFT